MPVSEALKRWYAEGTTFSYDGHSIFTKEAGRGDVILCLHGFPTASWDWVHVWERLAQDYRLVALDFLGFGYSDKPPNITYAIMDQANLVEALAQHFGIEQAHVLAHDYGDTVAQELIARHDEGALAFDLRSVCLLNGGLFPETHHQRLIQKLLLSPIGPLMGRVYNRRSFARTFRAIFGPDTPPMEQDLDDFWHLIEHNGGRLLAHKLIHYIPDRVQYRERWVAALQQTDVPVRLINGPEDPVSGAHMVVRYRELIPDPDTIELPGIGHYPQVEAPEQVLEAYLDFLTART